MTLRLNEHPDITVVLEDANFVEAANSKLYEKASLVAEIDEFWSQYQGSRTVATLKQKWKSGLMTALKFGDTNGVGSFAKIIRENKTEDIGFMLKGRVATPDGEHQLQLQIIRDASRAKQRGIDPVNESDFLKMINTIADSVQYRN